MDMHKFTVRGRVYRVMIETVSSSRMGERFHRNFKHQFEVPIDGYPVVILSEDCPYEVIVRDPMFGRLTGNEIIPIGNEATEANKTLLLENV